MRIAEIYKSIQGEGRLTGTESVFVRASGCNLRCGFCDTPFASWRPEGEDLSVAKILEKVASYRCRHAVLTGGEPMLFAELIPLCEGLASQDIHITIETAGTLFLPVACDLMSISPKMSNSAPCETEHPEWHQRHEQSRHVPGVISRLLSEYDCQLKFVVESQQDIDEIVPYLDEFADEIESTAVMLMPEGTESDGLKRIGSWLEPLCEQRGWQFCPRKHIEWFGMQRAT